MTHEQTLPAIRRDEPVEVGAIFLGSLSERVAALTVAANESVSAYEQAPPVRREEALALALRLQAHLGGIDEVLWSAGF